MNRLYRGLIFVAIAGIAAYLLFGALQPQYYVRTSFLLIPKSDVFGAQMDRVTHDVAFVMRDAVSSNDAADQGKTKITVTQVKQANIISVVGYGKTPDETKAVQSRALSRMIQHVRQYYADDMIAMQVVSHDRVPQKTFTAKAVPYMIFFFVAVGLIAGVFALFHYFDQLHQQAPPISGEKIFEKFHKGRMQKKASDERVEEEKVTIERKEHVEKADPARFPEHQNEMSDVPSEETVMVEEKNVASVPLAPLPDASIPDGISATPGNLPVVDISTLGFASRKEEKKPAQEDHAKEPTEEELKARLNALLNGKL